jgi:PIN domain nuclease of toxin-antitoxin system
MPSCGAGQTFEPKAAEACETGELWLSAASVWEIAIKSQIGRLPLPEPVRDFVGRQLRAGRITVLPMNASHACRAGEY